MMKTTREDMERNLSVKPRVPVSLITTLYNEEASVQDFMESLWSMTVLPEEIVIVDGGSKDRTVEILERFRAERSDGIAIDIIVDPTCTIYHTPSPIAKGRNIAIQRSTRPVIAVTDAGCLVDVAWLEEITRPLLNDDSMDFVAGWYEPLPRSYFEECQAMATFPSLRSVRPENFLPSSRSVAFRRTLWEAVGGYPERALGGEDTHFDLLVKERARRTTFVPQAVVYWKLRPTFRIFVKLVYRYGFGDGFCRILVQNAVRNSIKLAIPMIGVVLAIVQSTYWWIIVAGYLWLLPFAGDPMQAFRVSRFRHYPLTAFLKIVSTAAYLAGYIIGRTQHQHPLFEKESDHNN